MSSLVSGMSTFCLPKKPSVGYDTVGEQRVWPQLRPRRAPSKFDDDSNINEIFVFDTFPDWRPQEARQYFMGDINRSKYDLRLAFAAACAALCLARMQTEIMEDYDIEAYQGHFDTHEEARDRILRIIQVRILSPYKIMVPLLYAAIDLLMRQGVYLGKGIAKANFTCDTIDSAQDSTFDAAVSSNPCRSLRVDSVLGESKNDRDHVLKDVQNIGSA